MQRRIIGALKEGFNTVRGPDTTGIGLRTVQRVQQAGLNTRTALSHFQSIHSEHGANPQAIKQTLNSLFNLVAPNLSASARSILHSGPTSSATVLAHSQSNLARGVTRNARATFRPGFGGRPALQTARPQVHHVGLGSARGFATGAGRPVFQNIQNAPQYLRAIADQKDRLKQGKAEQRRARKAAKNGKNKGKKTARFSADNLYSTLFPVVKAAKPAATAAIVLTVPLEPTAAVTAATEIDAEAIASTSSSYYAQGHLFDASFLRVLRAREVQLARATNVYGLVQDAVSDGTATCETKNGPEEAHELVVRFDERIWSVADVRALLGLWDDLRDVWFGLTVDNAGWVNEGSHVEEERFSDVPTLSDISAHLASPRSSSSSLVDKASTVSSDHDHDLQAHDAVIETFQLPSIMFGASFVDHSPTRSRSSSPSISRNSTFSSSFDALSAAHSDGDDEQHLREFIDQITELEGGFPSRDRLSRLSAESGWTGGVRSVSTDSLGSWGN